ncbi:MAG: selenocysteine-specific translation elongation factor [Anaerolineae bacterium]|nr:MAG: selenocysteine-specific translation elongation factor [Anaerolineae bacterium]
MRVIGTAGHVDHGKSTLIAALTGIHPDRLKEEQEREMTIDLGFAWLTLPNGEEIGIVDVPGHRDFIENMLAGVGGIDAALLVVAADEGVMPQTREHLAILDLLQIPTGLIAITKTDLVSDPEWLDLVESDIRETVRGTVLEGAPCVRVSAKTKTGLEELLQHLAEVLGKKPARPDLGRPRLPVDRVFSIAGFGTVVTGTLTDGSLRVGDEVEILPAGHRGRVRGLQTHKKNEEVAVPGSRTAINISGVSVEQIRRGDVVTHPGQYRPTRRVDVRFRLLSDASAPLKHASEVKLFIAASETMARVRLLGVEVLKPGEEGWLQLELRHPVVAVRGDRFILRRPSPGETLGGGEIVDPAPERRHKRFAPDVIRKLEALAKGSPADVLFQAALALGPAPVKDIVVRSHLEREQAQAALNELFHEGRLLTLENGDLAPDAQTLVIATPHWEDLSRRAMQTVEAYHAAHPLRRGIPREELKSRLKIASRPFNALVQRLVQEEELAEDESVIARPGHEIRFDETQQAQVRALLQRFARSPYSPPTIKECVNEVGEEVFNALLTTGELVAVSSEVVFRREDYEHMVGQVRAYIQKEGKITVAQARDLFQTSRRYVLALLEHLDAIGVTVREGDFRRLRE